VQSAAPEAFEPVTADAHELSDLIGKDHDLALLAESAAARPERFAEGVSLDDFLALVARRRRKLQRKSLKVAGRLYEQKPKKLVRALS
jgi:hypothetical protein